MLLFCVWCWTVTSISSSSRYGRSSASLWKPLTTKCCISFPSHSVQLLFQFVTFSMLYIYWFPFSVSCDLNKTHWLQPITENDLDLNTFLRLYPGFMSMKFSISLFKLHDRLFQIIAFLYDRWHSFRNLQCQWTNEVWCITSSK